MIDKHSLESRDFSIALPGLISKIQFIQSSLVNGIVFDEFNPKDDFYLAAASMLEEISEDLKQIDKALYPPA